MDRQTLIDLGVYLIAKEVLGAQVGICIKKPEPRFYHEAVRQHEIAQLYKKVGVDVV